MVVSHSEFAGTVNARTITVGGNDSTTNTKISHAPLKLPLNPGDGRTFPWLTSVATRFEKYRFKKIKVHYLPTCSTLESGGVSLCPIYDPADPVPTDRITLLNAEGVVRGAVHNELTLDIPRGRMRSTDTMFVRETHEELVDANELRLSDLGYIAVSLSDATGEVNFGDIFVEYEVELMSPRVGPRNGKCAHYRREGFTNTGSVANTHCAPFGLDVSHEDRNNHSDANTLMFTVGSATGTYTDKGTSYDIDSNVLTFKEPFTGLMSYTHDVNGGVTGGGGKGIIINGKDSIGADRWDLKAGQDHKRTWGVADAVRSIASGIGYATEIWKVAVEAGESLELTWDGAFEDALSYAEVLLTDAAPELLALL